MRIIGTIRKVDQLGRIVLPKGYRRRLELNEHDQVEVLFVNNSIMVKKITTECAICGKEENLIDFNETLIYSKFA